MEMKNEMNKKYFVFGIVGSLILGGFIFFLTKGSTSSETQATPEPVATEATDRVEQSNVAETQTGAKADRFTQIERVGFFAYDSAELNSAAMATLTSWAEKLSEDSATLLNIEGHCDERGSVAYNLKLGKARAEAVKMFLVSKGVASTRLHTISFGENNPVDQGSNESSFAKNRRFQLKEVSAFAQN